jgi:hypothetical protein
MHPALNSRRITSGIVGGAASGTLGSGSVIAEANRMPEHQKLE